ncbi:hypothetical protein Q2490_07980 [Myroides odoratimimus]|uniref:hypothetical protein n=1 Tax=Myroides odoratimimus TaxID=76832 RepID=UPI00257785BA|nr:hypothetical protein [Myroides odoratimimus]MDM1442636.1 hypothetical protein [Myroides odoratimimus]MDM1496353.1 hypothetical protein [Myroides odoratimimus]MDO5857222.1 hypothetical protein [Myroides odoratimimus]
MTKVKYLILFLMIGIVFNACVFKAKEKVVPYDESSLIDFKETLFERFDPNLSVWRLTLWNGESHTPKLGGINALYVTSSYDEVERNYSVFNGTVLESVPSITKIERDAPKYTKLLTDLNLDWIVSDFNEAISQVKRDSTIDYQSFTLTEYVFNVSDDFREQDPEEAKKTFGNLEHKVDVVFKIEALIERKENGSIRSNRFKFSRKEGEKLELDPSYFN